MTSATITAPSESAPQSSIRWAFTDAITVTKRNLISYTRIPEALFFSSVQPIMFVLLFRYVFGGAIPTPGYTYVNYMMPGIFVQTVAFGAVSTSIGLAEDLQKGLVERFRALPMARSAVLAGRTTADLARNVLVVVLITLVGVAVGFRPSTGPLPYLAGVALLLLFAYALSWGFAIIGLSAPNSETAQVMSFPVLFPLTFASSAFVPVASMPGWLQGWAAHQPVTQVINAARDLMLGQPRLVAGGTLRPSGATGAAGFHLAQNTASTASTVLQAVVWCIGMIVVLMPLAVRQYRKVK